MGVNASQLTTVVTAKVLSLYCLNQGIPTGNGNTSNPGKRDGSTTPPLPVGDSSQQNSSGGYREWFINNSSGQVSNPIGLNFVNAFILTHVLQK